AVGVWDLIAWRLLGGLGVGAASVIAPAYIAEVASAKYRGRLGSLQQLAIVLGIFTALLSNALLADVAGGSAEQLWLGVDAWRRLGGLGVRAASAIAPAYIDEVAPAQHRGQLGTIPQLSIVLGSCRSRLSDAWLADVAGGSVGQRWLGADGRR